MTDTTHTPDAAPTGFASFVMQAGPVGGRLAVNGQDISRQVRRSTLIVDDGVPQLILEMRAGGSLQGEGVVQVVPDGRGGAQALSDAVLAFLDEVDPEQLEAAAMQEAGLSESPIRAALRVLQREAREAV